MLCRTVKNAKDLDEFTADPPMATVAVLPNPKFTPSPNRELIFATLLTANGWSCPTEEFSVNITNEKVKSKKNIDFQKIKEAKAQNAIVLQVNRRRNVVSLMSGSNEIS